MSNLIKTVLNKVHNRHENRAVSTEDTHTTQTYIQSSLTEPFPTKYLNVCDSCLLIRPFVFLL